MWTRLPGRTSPSINVHRLAALALLVLQSDEDAFWCLVAVVEAIMPQDYYTKNLVGLSGQQTHSPACLL